MTRLNSSTLLAERLRILLSERARMRGLLQKIEPYQNVNRFDERRSELETQIGTLVKSGIKSSASYPQDRHLAEAAKALLLAFRESYLLSEPKLVFNRSLVPGMQSNFAPELQARLLALCGPLDGPVAAILDSLEAADA